METYMYEGGIRKQLCRFACVELGVMMVFVNLRGMWHEPLWRIEGEQNWLRAWLHYGDSSPMLVLGPNDKLIVIDLKGYRLTH